VASLGGFVSLASAMAWPLATLVISFLFRDDIGHMLGRMGRLKYRDLELTFGADLRQAEELARSIPSAPAPAPASASALPSPATGATKGAVLLEVEASGPNDLGGEIIGKPRGPGRRLADREREGLAQLAGRSPRDAVFEAWAAIGQGLVKAAATRGDRRAPAPLRVEDAARFLVDRGWLVGPEAQLVERLRAIRDRVADLAGPPPTPEEARRYVALALPVAARLENLGRG